MFMEEMFPEYVLVDLKQLYPPHPTLVITVSCHDHHWVIHVKYIQVQSELIPTAILK